MMLPGRLTLNLQSNSFGIGARPDYFNGGLKYHVDLDWSRLQAESAGDDAGHIENVVNQPRLGLRRSVRITSTACCIWAFESVPRTSMCAHPRIAVKGVRNSCEIVARNSSFILFDVLGFLAAPLFPSATTAHVPFQPARCSVMSLAESSPSNAHRRRSSRSARTGIAALRPISALIRL